MNRRTSLITAAAIGGALLVGSGAIAANIGVLNSAADDSIGNLTAEAAVQVPAEAQVVDVYIEDPPVPQSTVTPTVAETSDVVAQQFAVEAAGAVTVEQTSTGLFVSDVQANEGWSWTTEQSAANALDVTFVSGDTTYEFYAEVGTDGLIAARVDQPVINIVQAPAPAPSAGSNNSGGGYEYDDDDDDRYENDDDRYEYDDDDHEGGDDDD